MTPWRSKIPGDRYMATIQFPGLSLAKRLCMTARPFRLFSFWRPRVRPMEGDRSPPKRPKRSGTIIPMVATMPGPGRPVDRGRKELKNEHPNAERGGTGRNQQRLKNPIAIFRLYTIGWLINILSSWNGHSSRKKRYLSRIFRGLITKHGPTTMSS